MLPYYMNINLIIKIPNMLRKFMIIILIFCICLCFTYTCCYFSRLDFFICFCYYKFGKKSIKLITILGLKSKFTKFLKLKII